MIKKLTIEAISIKPNKKDGTPYTYAEKDKKTKVATGKILPRTMVSLKSGEDWYMGWSYKANSAAESLQVGQTIDVVIEETPDKLDPNKIWKSWKLPKQEDIDKQKIADLEAQIAKMNAPTVPTQAPVDNPQDVSKVPF